MIDVSIVIPALNEERYLPRTLESIKKQKFNGEIEIIVADAKSTDKTGEIAKKYGCKVVITEPGSIAEGRQRGCEKAKGKIIVNAGADVIYEEEWLERLTGPIKKEEAIATCGKIRPDDGKKIEEIFADRILNPIAEISYLIRIPFAVGDNIAIRKDIFKKVGGFNPKLVTSEDTELISRLMKEGMVKYVAEAVAHVSMRRVRAWGYNKYLTFHAKNFIKFHLTKKAEDEYEPVR